MLIANHPHLFHLFVVIIIIFGFYSFESRITVLLYRSCQQPFGAAAYSFVFFADNYIFSPFDCTALIFIYL